MIAKCYLSIIRRRIFIHYCRNGEPFLAEVLLNLLTPLVDPAFTHILIRENLIRSRAVEKQHCRLYLCSRLSLAYGSEIPHPCITENSISCILGNFQYCFPALSSILIISVSPCAFFRRKV